MNVNLTLVVQAVHFGIAYIVISRLFLKPALALVTAEHTRRDRLRNQLIEAQHILSEKKEHKRQHWLTCQNYFNRNRPHLEYVPERPLTQSIKPPRQLSPHELKKLAREIAQALQQKVMHG